MTWEAGRRTGEGSAAILKGLAAYGMAEFAVRIVRLGTVVLIARRLAPEVVGVAALALTVFEIVRVLANIGVGQRIIAAPAEQLAATCNTAHRIFWTWCAAISVLQIAVSAILAIGFHQEAAGAMLAVLALVYLWMPGGLVPCYLLMREGRVVTTARTTATQTIADHLLTAALLLIWSSPWSIVLPKLLTAPIWLILTRRARPWRPDPDAGQVPVAALTRFGLSVLATEMLIALRGQCDKLIVAATLGVSALGTYFFAFNAGIGIVASLITAFGTVVLPHLCGAAPGAARAQRMTGALLLGAALFVPLIVAQAGLAPFYVPIVFGARWAHAATLIAILALAGLPMFLATATTTWLRANDRPGLDAQAGVLSCAMALGGLALGAHTGGLAGAAAGWVAGLTLAITPFAATILSRALRPAATPAHRKAMI